MALVKILASRLGPPTFPTPAGPSQDEVASYAAMCRTRFDWTEKDRTRKFIRSSLGNLASIRHASMATEASDHCWCRADCVRDEDRFSRDRLELGGLDRSGADFDGGRWNVLAVTCTWAFNWPESKVGNLATILTSTGQSIFDRSLDVRPLYSLRGGQ